MKKTWRQCARYEMGKGTNWESDFAAIKRSVYGE